MKSTSQSFASACARLLLGVALACFGLTDHLPAQQKDALNPTRDGAASAAANEDDTEVVQLNVFTVEGTKGQSYGASNLASATRLNTPAENVPQSISVINSNLLRDIGAYQFDQVMRYTPGVTPRQNAPNASIVRGFIVANRYRNGFLMPQYETDTINIDRVEIIKGPSASIAGSSESGGLVNFITKKPLFELESSITLTAGSYGFMRGTVDTTGPVPGHDNMAYRLVAAGTSSDTYRDNDHLKKFAIYPSFLWNLTKKTQLLVELEYLQGDTPGGFGAVYFAPIEAGAPFATVPPPAGVTPKVQLNRWAPLTLNTSGEPGMTWSHEVSTAFITLTHAFNDIFSVRQAVNFYQFVDDHYWASVNNTLYFDAAGNLFANRTMTDRYQDTRGVRLQGDVALKMDFGSRNLAGLVLLAGYDVADIKNDLRQATGVLPAMNLVNPTYGLPATTPLAATVDQSGKNGSVGIFANTQVSFLQDRIILTGGLRRDYNKEARVDNHFNNTSVITPKTPTIESPLVGLTLKPLPWLALYGVDSEAGAARTTISIYPGIPINDPLQKLVTIEPVTTNKEFGAKMNFRNGGITVNIAKFKIVQSDFVRPTTDLSAPGGQYRTIDQGVTADGWEIEWAGDLTKQLLVYGGYTHMKTKVPAVRPGGLDGEQRGVPRHKFQLFARYNLTDVKDRGLSVRAGVVYENSHFGIAQNTYRVPGATRWDVGADYRYKDWVLGLTIENVTDVIFPQAAIAAGSNTVDAPRTSYLSLSRRF